MTMPSPRNASRADVAPAAYRVMAYVLSILLVLSAHTAIGERAAQMLA
jgi:hypothetical protein